MHKKVVFTIFLLLFIGLTFAQQQPDLSFNFKIETPNFTGKKTPIIYIDGNNNNFHQLDSGFAPFAKLANMDGYETHALSSYQDLKKADIFVIANPINEKNQGNWQRPIYSEFDINEVDTIVTWVKNGGNLLLIADHMPFAGAANELANAFGFDFCDGFARLSKRENRQDVFSISNNRLLASPLTNGSIGKKIDKIISFTGSAFLIPQDAIGVMKFQTNDYCLAPEIAWQFETKTDTTNLQNYYQGALLEYGKGKVAVFGEAAMFTAQIYTRNEQTFRFGFTAKGAEQNIDFIRNVLYWLASDLEEKNK